MGDSRNSTIIIRLCFYSCWLILAVLQANYTELIADEAYYWKYAQDLQWGYFDHPPVVAAMIKPGYWLFQNELGVRLLFILCSIGFLFLLELLARPKNLTLFYLVISSIGAFHFLGFLAIPDMPLLFFSASFLWLYKRYLTVDGWGISLLLAANATLLLLSKYHGILLIGFIILSNPTLLKRKTFWLISLLSVNLFIPHIQWQIAHDMPSIKYHLAERSDGIYHINYTLNYLLSVVLIFGPMIGLVLAWHAIKRQTRIYTFERTLKVVLVGTLSFFLLMTFKGKAEANWVAPALIPAVISGYSACENKAWFSKLTKYSFGLSLFIIFNLRLFLVYDYLPDRAQFAYIKNKTHNSESWAKSLQSKAEERPVVFMNKYQHAALYEFYTGHSAISLNNRIGRKNQYNIWVDEYDLQGKEVMLIPNNETPDTDSIPTSKGIFEYRYLQNFRSASFIHIKTNTTKVTAQPGDEIHVTYSVYTNIKEYNMEANQDLPPMMHVLLFENGEMIFDHPTNTYLFNSMINDGEKYSLSFRAPEKKGTYSFYVDIAMGWLPAAINSNKITLIVQ